MKFKNIAKASLAIGILTTGIITATDQPAKASFGLSDGSLDVISNETHKLKMYYTGYGFELKNLNGYKEKDVVTFTKYSQQTDVKLTGYEKSQFNDEKLSNVDVFVVRENSDRSGLNKSIGGITKTNTQDYKDYIKNVSLKVTKKIDSIASMTIPKTYYIYKEEISLKELDFKLRKLLIEKHDLYQTEPKDSTIRVIMENGGHYTFELNKKLQEHRMGDVIDGTKIKEINVELK
ncbi:exotoxin beta-grasp domain-containing protein [Staphylococcus aureus]|uniref:exotoxin beta-grasp domain-containing protein n=1 Tax=Staphylococcus aureus TaxID=1280 RepID=UPI0021CEA3A4|nr:superantigen-like protein [Staphylococcus aureus]UXT64026.1 superantigen-like protein [Staphylococcus aureus]HDL0574852.1 superantigen-like protein [Staphylococcus aureus]